MNAEEDRERELQHRWQVLPVVSDTVIGHLWLGISQVTQFQWEADLHGWFGFSIFLVL